MLIAKLKNSIKLKVEIAPNKFHEREGNAFSVITFDYQLGMKNYLVRVDLSKEESKPLNPSSQSEDEKFYVKNYNHVKAYQILLNEDDLAKWGNDDTDLLRVVAEKLDVEIESILDIMQEKIKVEKEYKEYREKKLAEEEKQAAENTTEINK